MTANIAALSEIERQARTLNNEDANLQAKYGGDSKLMRVHKRLVESGRLPASQVQLHTALSGNSDLLNKPEYFARQLMPDVVRAFSKVPPPPDADTCRLINQLLVGEYLAESQGRLPLQ